MLPCFLSYCSWHRYYPDNHTVLDCDGGHGTSFKERWLEEAHEGM